MTVSWWFGSFHPRILENPPHHQFNREVRFICWVCLLFCVVFGKLFTLAKNPTNGFNQCLEDWDVSTIAWGEGFVKFGIQKPHPTRLAFHVGCLPEKPPPPPHLPRVPKTNVVPQSQTGRGNFRNWYELIRTLDLWSTHSLTFEFWVVDWWSVVSWTSSKGPQTGLELISRQEH